MKYECLKLEDRRIIEEMYAKGAKPGEIAERVGKCQATIYRELERGKTGETDSRFRQGYSPIFVKITQPPGCTCNFHIS